VGLADTLGTVYEAPLGRMRCSVATLLESLDNQGDRDALAQALDDPNLRSTEISKWLSRHGYTIGSRTIGRHRNRASGDGCRCPL
jgi:hypothetical protein